MTLRPSSLVRVFLVLGAVVMLASGCRFFRKKPTSTHAAAPAPREAAALESLRGFLAAIDQHPDTSWPLLATPMQAQVPAAMWNSTLADLKAKCGALVDRQQAQFAYTEQIPGAPAGHYFVYEIPARFEKISVTERVVLVEEGKSWKVAGYFRLQAGAPGAPAPAKQP